MSFSACSSPYRVFPSVARRGLAAGAAVAACWLAAPSARADTVIAADLDFVVPINDGSEDISSGAGFGIRVGQQLDLPALVLTPELGFTYAGFDGGVKAYRGVAGLRLGVGEILRPGVFAHAGIGRLSFDMPSGVADPSHTAFTFDAGAFLDFTLLPFLNIGAHAAYNRQAGSDELDAFQWASLGAHAALVF
ncbi:MAG TPA: hypothetical protein VI072_01570 [Polyangiaceae bacterium]